jgi:hypothetical protein
VEPELSIIQIKDGMVYQKGRPSVLINAEYPSFRDDPNHWKDRLLQLRSLGIRVISTYIPWRANINRLRKRNKILLGILNPIGTF